MSITVKNIHKTFGHFTALNNVSLDFPSGELVALLGPSGCGKTTLLRIIAGLETPDSGSIILDDIDTSKTPIRERSVGFVFQHYALFKHMTVFDNVAFGLQVKPRSSRPSKDEISDKVHKLLSLVQLDWLHDRFPAQLSGGQRQRIALARALAVEPKVLLLDEPFGALDAKVRKELRRWLRKLHDELHITSIFVTHDQEEALEVADRIVLMNQGNIEQIGSPDEVYDHPATPFVYGFLGNVNLFHGRVDGEGIQIGNDKLSHQQSQSISQGASVIAFARPHELNIEIINELANDHARGISATIDRILSIGPNAKIELSASSLPGDKNSCQFYEVELPRAEVIRRRLAEGQLVRIVASKLRVFEQPQQAH
jgi:sulfate transport system ATP-binding protein